MCYVKSCWHPERVTKKPAIAKVIDEGACRCCSSTTRTLSRHHLVPESWFEQHPGVPGRNSRDNIVPLCFYCHRAVDGHLKKTVGIPINLRRTERRRQLRAKLTADETAFIVRTVGDAWLEHHYPSSTPWHRPIRATPHNDPARELHLPGCDTDYCCPGCRVRTKPIRYVADFVARLPYGARID